MLFAIATSYTVRKHGRGRVVDLDAVLRLVRLPHAGRGRGQDPAYLVTVEVEVGQRAQLERRPDCSRPVGRA